MAHLRERCLVVSVLLYCLIELADAAAAESYCSSGGSWGTGSCTGDVFLRGQFVEAGIHQAGSFGTATNAPTPFQASEIADKRLSFMADYDKNGWNVGSPAYSGDYSLPGTPTEGWLVQYTDASTTTLMINKALMLDTYGSNYYVQNFGANGTMPVNSVHITSDDERQSMFWVGQFGNLQVRFNVVFGNEDTYITSSVTLRNIGSTQLTNLYFMRSIDPDQEQPHTGAFYTRNWVKYQPFTDGDPTGYVSDDDSNLALVLARGHTYEGLICGLGTSSPNARVSFYGFDNNDPVVAYAANSGTYAQWKSYGGKNVEPSDTSKQHYADEALNLAFYFPTLDAGAAVDFDLVYMLNSENWNASLVNLNTLKILQPSSVMSGAVAMISVQISEDVGIVNRIAYWIYAMKSDESVENWHLIDDIAYEYPESESNTFTIMFDTTEFAVKQDVQLKVEVNETITGSEPGDSKKHVKLKPGSISNVGAQMCFDVPDSQNNVFNGGTVTTLDLKKCDGYTGALPTKVQFYREVTVLGSFASELVKTDTTAGDGFAVDVSVDDLPEGTQVFVTARSSLGADVTAVTITGLVAISYPPSNIVLSKNVVEENSPTHTLVGTFTVVDPNAADTHTLTLTNDAGGRFAIAGLDLLVNSSIDFEATPSLLIEVRADDGGAANCCITKQFTIVVLNSNDPPSAIYLECDGESSCAVHENSPIDTLVGTLSTMDEDTGQVHTFSIVGDSYFKIVGDKLLVAKLINFEQTGADIVVAVSVVDNGSPPQSLTMNISIAVLDMEEDCPNGCGAGRYMSEGGFCHDCPVGSSSSMTCTDVVNTCTPCEPGSYADGDGSSTCTQCGPGKYSSEVGAASLNTCTLCEPGRYASGDGSSTCTQCGAGRYSSEVGATCESSCWRCPAGKYSSAVVATSPLECELCPAGRYGTQEGAPSDSACVACAIDTFTSSGGMPSCNSCPYGTCTKEQDGQTTCENCSKFLQIGQMIGCKPCSESASATICENDDAVFDCPTMGLVAMSIIVTGGNMVQRSAEDISVVIGNTACPITSYDAHQSTISCTLPPGVGSNLPITITDLVTGQAGAANRLSYAAPTINTVAGCSNVEPLPHPSGTSGCLRQGGVELITITGVNFGPAAVDVEIDGERVGCEQLEHHGLAGWEQNTTIVRVPSGSGEFVNVNVVQPKGVRSSALPMLSYERCKPGTFNQVAADGSFSCEPCAIGRYSSQYEAVACTPCTAGFYCDATTETPCPYEFSTSPAESSSATECHCRNNLALTGDTCVCSPGRVLSVLTLQCEECGVGTYKEGWNLDSCVSCPAMMTTNGTGARSADACECSVSLNADSLNSSCACGAGYGYSAQLGCQACPTNYYTTVAAIDPCKSCKDIHPVAISTLISASTSCECPSGYFMEGIISDTEFTCSPCAHGMRCAASGQALSDVALESGFWRGSSSSQLIRECVIPAACSQQSTSDQCAHAQTGPMCAVCEPGYSSYSTYALCSACVDQLIAGGVVIGMGCLVLIACVAAYRRVPWFAVNCQWVWQQFNYDRGVRVHLKALFVYMQLSAGFGRLLDADYPPAVNSFFAWLSVVNFSPSGFLKCIFGDSFNFYGKLLVMTLVPIGLGMVVVAYSLFAIWNDRANSAQVLDHKNSLMSRTILLCFLVFCPVSTVIFEAFSCDDDFDGGESYLRADYSVSCTTSVYRSYRAYATFMLFVYPLGIPAFCFWLLFLNRYAIYSRAKPQSDASTVGEVAESVADVQDVQRLKLKTPMNQRALASLNSHVRRAWQLLRAVHDVELAGVRSLFEAYRPELWFFEMVEMLRRLLLSGLLVFMYPGTNKQLVLAVLLCAVFNALYTFLNPFMSAGHNIFLRAAQWGIFCQLFGTLMLQQNTFSGHRELVGALIITFGILVPLIGVVLEKKFRTVIWAVLTQRKARQNFISRLKPSPGPAVADQDIQML